METDVSRSKLLLQLQSLTHVFIACSTSTYWVAAMASSQGKRTQGPENTDFPLEGNHSLIVKTDCTCNVLS